MANDFLLLMVTSSHHQVESQRVPGAAPMLDLTVEYDHTFYVALNDTAVLVHNNNCKLSSPNPVTNKSIRNEYEEIITGNGTPRIDPATGQQTIHRGGPTTRAWAGAKELGCAWYEQSDS